MDGNLVTLFTAHQGEIDQSSEVAVPPKTIVKELASFYDIFKMKDFQTQSELKTFYSQTPIAPRGAQ